MSKKRVLILSLSLIVSTMSVYPQSPPWYSRVITFVQETFWNPFVQIIRRLFRTNPQRAAQIAALTQRVQTLPRLEPVELVLGGPSKNIIDIKDIEPDQEYALVGLFDGNKKSALWIKQELERQLQTTPLIPLDIKGVFTNIEEQFSHLMPNMSNSASGFIMLGTKICLFNIGTSQTMLFKQTDKQLQPMFTTVKHLISDKDERERLEDIASKTSSLITLQTQKRFGQDPVKHGMYFDYQQKKWVLEGLPTSRFLGNSYIKNLFDEPIRKALAEPDVTCFSLQPGTYYVVIATEGTHLTPKTIQDAFSSQLYHDVTINSAFVSAAIDIQSELPLGGKYIVVRCIIR